MSKLEEHTGVESTLTAIGCLIVTICLVNNTDIPRGKLIKVLEYGDKVCAPHRGLESFDLGGEYTCKDGTVVQHK